MSTTQDIPHSVFMLLSLESIKYILSKKLEPKEQKSQIEEIGIHLGERSANHLMNTKPIPQTKSKNEDSDCSLAINFLSDQVWTFVFGNQIKKTTHNGKGLYSIEDHDILLHHYLRSERDNRDEDKLDCIVWFICGIIKGVLLSFNYSCTIETEIKANDPSTGKSLYSFTLKFLNDDFK